MADLFSGEWMKGSMSAWNGEPEITTDLKKNGFNLSIGYNFFGQDTPPCVIIVENGKATSAGAYDGEEMNLDMRVDQKTWEKWLIKPPGMMGPGTANTSKKLQFLAGHCGTMPKDPRMASPCIKSFSAMGKA